MAKAKIPAAVASLINHALKPGKGIEGSGKILHAAKHLRELVEKHDGHCSVAVKIK
jgi:hypothetical protein